MGKKAFVQLMYIGLCGLLLVESSLALPKKIQKGRMEVTQEYKEKNVYRKDIYRGIFKYKHKKNAFGYVIPMVTVYNKNDTVILQAFTYIDFTKVELIKGAYAQFCVYTPHVESYDHHKIELYLIDQKYVKNYETVVATQAMFAKSLSERRRTKTTASPREVELFNKHRRNLKPPMEPMDVIQSTNSAISSKNSGEKDEGEINWNSPFVYGFKWGGFNKKDNFTKY